MIKSLIQKSAHRTRRKWLLGELLLLYVLFPALVLSGTIAVSDRWLAWIVTACYVLGVMVIQRPKGRVLGIGSRREVVRVIPVVLLASGVSLVLVRSGLAPVGFAGKLSPYLVFVFYPWISVPVQEFFFRGFFFLSFRGNSGSSRSGSFANASGKTLMATSRRSLLSRPAAHARRTEYLPPSHRSPGGGA